MTAPVSRDDVRADLFTGLTVAMVALPQAVAFALLSGVPPAHGIATAGVAAVVAGLFGRSAQVASGPTNTTSLLILGAMAPFLGANGLVGEQGLPALAALTLLAGALRLALALSGGSQLVRFLPESVLAGFTAGAATLIVGMLADEALGLPAVRAQTLRAELAGLAEHVGHGRFPAAPSICLALLMLAVGLAGRRRFPRFPVALTALVAVSALVWAFGLDEAAGVPIVADRTAVPAGWPRMTLPSTDFAVLERLLTPGIAIVLLGTLELTVSARAGGQRPDMRREILAQGWANVACSATGGFPASASFTRSALLRLFGARTRVAAVASGLFTVPVVLFGSRFLEHVPLAALAGVVMAAAWSMLDRAALRRLWHGSRETRLLLGLTFVSTLVLPLERAVLLGIGAGLLLHIANTSSPRLTLLTEADGRLRRVAPGERPETVVLEVSGNLHYAAVPPFLEEAERLLPESARTVVLDLSHAHEIRFTAMRALEQLDEELRRDGARLILAGVEDDVVDLFRRSETTLRFVQLEPEPGRSVERALAGGMISPPGGPP